MIILPPQEGQLEMNRENTTRHGKNSERFLIYGATLVLKMEMNYEALPIKKK